MITANVPIRQFVSIVALSFIAGACGRIPGQFEILNNQVPLDGCVIPTNQTVYQGQGRLDLSLVSGSATSAYLFFPLLKNNLDPSSSGVDVNQIDLNSFAVDITPVGTLAPATQALFDSLNSDASLHWMLHTKSLWSGSIGSGGMLSAVVNAVPIELANRLRATQEIGISPSLALNLRVRAFGKTTSKDIESDPFDFPIYVCEGCLVANVQPCPYTVAPTNTGNACNSAQDDPVDCCLSGNDLLCPPPVVGK